MYFTENEISVSQIVDDLRKSAYESSLRGLYNSAKWANDLLVSIKESENDIPKSNQRPCNSKTFRREFNKYLQAKSLYDLKEFRRAFYILTDCKSKQLLFLQYYCLFLDGERLKHEAKQELTLKNLEHQATIVNKELNFLNHKLATLYKENSLDGFLLYLYGIVLKELQQESSALDIMKQACNQIPWFITVWEEISILSSTRPEEFTICNSVGMPNHWMYDFYVAQFELERHRNDEAIHIYQKLMQLFSRSHFVKSRVALCKYNLCEFQEAREMFTELHDRDPNCLESMDTLSDIFHVQKEKHALGELAHDVTKVNIRRPEACCIVGNYYSVQEDHEKAVLYFKRAIELNPNYLAAWLYMGHEYLDLRNMSRAIEAYRTALEINPKEYRAWYKLGYAYESLRLYPFAFHYYRVAAKLRPYDERLSSAVEHLMNFLIECEDQN